MAAWFAVAGVQMAPFKYKFMFIWCKKSFYSQHMSDSEAGGPIEKDTFWDFIFALKVGLWPCGLSKIHNILGWSPSLLSLVFRYVFWIQKIFSPSMWAVRSRRLYWIRHLFMLHIWSKVRVVGYPKIIKTWNGRLLCCRWCLDIFIGYNKAFFSQHMSYGKAAGPIEKGIFWASHLIYN